MATPQAFSLKVVFDNLDHMGNPFKLKSFDSAVFFNTKKAKLSKSETDYEYAWKFLYSYNGSTATFNSYRREIERIILWAWHIHESSILDLKREDIEQYIGFCVSPPTNWIGVKNVARFKLTHGERLQNPDWRPFVVTVKKDDARHGIKPTEKDYIFSQSGIQATFSILSSFFNFLIQEEVSTMNPVALIRQKSKYTVKQQHQSPVRRVSNIQWEYVIETIETLANQDPDKYERSLFILNALFSLYLRISELVADERSVPVMSDFRKDVDGNWWLHVTGKGNKSRIVTVSQEMLASLKRYRLFLGLSPLPIIDDTNPILPKIIGKGPITSTRIVRSIVQDCFDIAFKKMKQDGLEDDAQELKVATVHWLRHTGISEDVKTRPREHVRDDAGHASMQTTDRYIESDLRERHASGKHKRTKNL
jgi:site-specific recombinase XerD